MEYVYGRVRGRRARLLGPEMFEVLLREDLASYENILKDTRYGKYISQLKSYSGVDLYIVAINRAFTDEVRKLLSFLEGEKEKLSLETFLSRWDLYNLITVVRGRFYSVSDEEIRRSLFPAGVLDELRLKELLAEESALAVAERAKIAFKNLPFSITREAILSLRNGDLAAFEYHLYSSFYKRIFTLRVHPLIKEFYAFTIDSKNISMAFISLLSGNRPSHWLEGGKISPKIRKQVMLMEDPEELVTLVRRYVRFEGEFSLTRLDEIFERRFYDEVERGFAVDPVSFYAVMEYLWRLEREVIKLRTIIYAKSFGLPREKIKEVVHV
ncbi:MAG: hypothetical protein GXO39_09870 [Thermotogae bacterium]|nr:hypothetical protein [Thermotogota bacterium]